jgi:hypothetical protein
MSGGVDPKVKAVTLPARDITAAVSPVAIFRKSGDGTPNNLAKLAFTVFVRRIAPGDY